MLQDETLMLAVRNLGKDWKKIGMAYLPNRSSLDLSNRYVLLCHYVALTRDR